MRTVRRLLALAALAAAYPAGVGRAADPEPVPSPAVILQRYFANAQIQKHLICQFTVKEGDAASVADARARKFKDKVLEFDGFWCFDGAKEHFRIDGPEAALVKMEAEGRSSVYLQVYLTDGQSRFRGGVDVRVGNLYPPGSIRQPRPPAFTPLNFFGTPYERFLEKSGEPGYATARRTDANDVAQGLRLDLVDPSPEDRMAIIFDPNRGYLPVWHATNVPTVGDFETYITSTKQLPSGQWVPTGWTFLQHYFTSGVVRLFTLDVTDLDGTTVPTDEQFVVDLSRYYQVTEQGHKMRVYNPVPGDKLTPGTMDLWAEKLVKVGEVRAASEGVTPAGDQRDPYAAGRRIGFLALVVLGPVVVAALLLWRQKRRAASPVG